MKISSPPAAAKPSGRRKAVRRQLPPTRPLPVAPPAELPPLKIAIFKADGRLSRVYEVSDVRNVIIKGYNAGRWLDSDSYMLPYDPAMGEPTG